MRHLLFYPLVRWTSVLICFLFAVHTSGQALQLVVPMGHHRFSNPRLNGPGDLLLSQENQVLLVWDVKYRRVLYNLTESGRKLITAEFSPGGYELLVVTDDSAARLIDLRTGALRHRIRFRNTKLADAAFSGDGNRIITAHDDSSIVSWDAARMVVTSVRKWDGIPLSIASNASGDYLLIAHDSTVVDGASGDVTRTRVHRLLHVATGKKRPLNGFVAFVPARNALLRMASAARLEDVATGRLLLSMPHSFSGAWCLSPDGRYFATGDNFDIHVWNLQQGKLEKKLPVRISSGVITELKMHAFADSNRRIIASYDREVQVLDWKGRGTEFTGWDSLRMLMDPQARIPDDISVSRNGKAIAGSYSDGRIRVYHFPDLHFPAVLEGHSPIVNGIRYNKRYGRLFSMHNYKDVKCWNLQRMRLDYTITDTTFCAAANAFRFCRSGENLFVDVCEGFEGIFDVATGKPLNIDSVGEDCRSPLASAANKTRLQKGYVQGWSIVDADTDSLLRMIDSSGYVKQAFLSPGGTKLVLTTNLVDAVGLDKGINVQLIDLIKGDTLQLLQSAAELEDVQFGDREDQMVVLTKDRGVLLFEQGANVPYYLGEYRSAAFVGDSLLALADLSEIVLYQLKHHRLQAHLIALQGDDFLVLLPDGYYSAHLQNLGKLHYTRNGKIVSFEQLDLRYNRPDKVLTAFGSKDTVLVAAYRNAYLKRLQRLGIDTASFAEGSAVPNGDFVGREQLAAQQRGRKLTIRYRATDSLSALEGFNVWVNEVPLFGSRGMRLDGQRALFDTTMQIVLSRGENRIEASVRNRAGLESYRMPLFVSYLPPDSVGGKTHFIGIGANRFADSTYNLSWSVKDIRDLCGKLREKYPAMLVDTLFDEQVTRENILALKKKLLLLDEEDRVIVSYSGHGVLSSKLDYYLSTWNIGFQNPANNGLPYDEFEALLDSIRPRRKLVLIDACHSGEVDKEEVAKIEAGRSQFDSTGVRPRGIAVTKSKQRLGMRSAFELMQELFTQVSRGTGTTIIAAAGGTQFAFERGDFANGVFTYSFLNALQRFRHISVIELSGWLSAQVEQLTGGLQRPASRGSNNQTNWMVW
ncbi:MAG: WD40 repeat domain-containing protein [Chitinophagaceae bacterium]|nr:MAG: WD40 repeat domain-containing protein [Chitinophagaceae bacterium]